MQQIVQLAGIAFEQSAVILQAKVLNILVGIIQHRVEVAAQVHQIVIDGGQLLLQHAPHLSGGVGGGVGGIRFDEINDGFRLRQIHFSVEKGPPCIFSRLGTSASGFYEGFHYLF